MVNKRVSQIRQLILKCNTELLRIQPKLDFSEDVNLKYNKVLIQKAILKKELDEIQRPVLKKIATIFKDNREKIISDYFAS
jgi:hypothetical protein